MISAEVRAEVGGLRKYPALPTDFEIEIIKRDLQTGTLLRKQQYQRYGLVGLAVPFGGIFKTKHEIKWLWAFDLMTYSGPQLTINHAKSSICVTPEPGEGFSKSLTPYSFRRGVDPYHLGNVTVSSEGFVLSEGDTQVPSGVERPLGGVLVRAMERGETTGLLAGRTYVWVGEEHAGKSLFRIPLGRNGIAGYHDAAIVGPMEGENASLYKDGSPINTVYPSRVIQILDS